MRIESVKDMCKLGDLINTETESIYIRNRIANPEDSLMSHLDDDIHIRKKTNAGSNKCLKQIKLENGYR